MLGAFSHIWRIYPDPILNNWYNRGHNFDFSIIHDAYMPSLPKWLVDPRGYVILTACGPREIAQELCLKSNGARSDAL